MVAESLLTTSEERTRIPENPPVMVVGGSIWVKDAPNDQT